MVGVALPAPIFFEGSDIPQSRLQGQDETLASKHAIWTGLMMLTAATMTAPTATATCSVTVCAEIDSASAVDFSGSTLCSSQCWWFRAEASHSSDIGNLMGELQGSSSNTAYMGHDVCGGGINDFSCGTSLSGKGFHGPSQPNCWTVVATSTNGVDLASDAATDDC